MGEPTLVRRRRETGWWEPTYNPALVGQMALGVWSFENERGPIKKIFYGDDLSRKIEEGGARYISNISFTTCDFQGFFQAASQISFSWCEFVDCDLALTTWRNVKFSNCRFVKTSFGMTALEQCEFRNCHWQEVGFSPNETTLVETLVNNPAEMIAASVTNLDPDVLKAKKVSRITQICKLETTKATIARQVLKSFEKAGDERSYYEAVKTFELQQAKGRIYDAFRVASESGISGLKRLSKGLSCPFWAVEYACLSLIGLVSGWGASIIRPILVSMGFFVLFAELYKRLGATTPVQRSLEISLLAGYTNYHSETHSLTMAVQAVQLLVSCFLYSLTFAAILSRFSRVR